MKFHINIEYQDRFFTLFLLGYTSDGGFFVKDLINDGGEFIVMRSRIPQEVMRRFGTHKISMDKVYFWTCKQSPKMTHHVNGNVHVSGDGIISGFYKFFSGTKGVFSKGMDLNKRDNDGGPFFIFNTQNLPSTVCKVKNSISISKKDQLIDQYYKPRSEEDYSFVLEFFYLPKSEIKNINLARGTVPFKHINYGVINLKYIPAPKQSPGFIAVFARVVAKGNPDNSFSFSLNGGTSKLLPSGEHEQISIIYPHDKEMTKGSKIKNIDFRGLNKLKVEIDFWLDKIFRK